MMSRCVVPNWNVSHQRKAQVEEERNTSSHVDNQYNYPHAVPMPNYEVVEFTSANGQLATQGLGRLLPAAQTQATTGKAGDHTLESIVHQATRNKADSSRPVLMAGQGMLRKRMRPDSEHCGRNIGSGMEEHHHQRADRGACASASTGFCRDNDTTMMTWTSFETPKDLKNKTIDVDDDSAWQDGSVNILILSNALTYT